MLWTVVKEAAENWSNHKDSRQGAALAYYSVFSLAPIIVIVIAIAGFFFGQEAVSGQVAASIKDALGDTGAQVVQAMLVDAARPREGLFATLLGIGALIFAAIGVVVQLKDALNTVWEVQDPTGQGIWQFIRSYIVSLAAVFALGFLLIVSLIVTAALAAFGKYAAPHVNEWLLHVVTDVASVGVLSLLFAMMFKWLPDTAVDWYDVWLGAVVTAVLFELGKAAIGFYIGKQGLESTYGAAASIIVVLIWVYYTSQIILMGAEITHAFAAHKGSIKKRGRPAEYQAG
ncbi:MAG: rane protein [Bradyrhizobium sp.]|jgi:membrane protein|nr:rane protein [Bradyrhizobium sp.]